MEDLITCGSANDSRKTSEIDLRNWERVMDPLVYLIIPSFSAFARFDEPFMSKGFNAGSLVAVLNGSMNKKC